MQYNGGFVNFGNSGLKVSRVAFGCGFRGTPDPKECERTILAAIDTGINFIDCANIYVVGNGERSETVLGNVLKQVKRDNLVITTKVGLYREEWPLDANAKTASRYHILREVEGSLKRLNTDHIDIYLLHMPDRETPMEEQLRALEQLCKDGKVRYVGLCNYKAWQVTHALGIQKQINAQPMLAIQNPYHLLNRTMEDEMFPMLRETGVGMMSYSSLGTGLLGGQYLRGKPMPEKAFWYRSEIYRRYYPYVFKGQVEEVVMAVHDMAQRYGCSMSHIAMSWVLSHPEVTSVVAGANTIDEFHDMLKTFDVKIDPADINYLSDLSEGLRLQLTIWDVKETMGRMDRMAKAN
jgi:aryl-alcohol dehydrogenase-like predicted oxidoreductase